MSNVNAPFSPLGNVATITTVANGTSVSTPVPGAISDNSGNTGGDTVRVINTNTNPILIVFSDTTGGAVATAATGALINAGEDKNVSVSRGMRDCAIWGLGAGVASVYVQRGSGL